MRIAVQSPRDQKQVLVPMRVAWMVSPSTPFLRLEASESPSQDGTKVEFVAYYQCQDEPTPPTGGVRIVQPPGPFQPVVSDRNGPYRLIRISFKSGLWTRTFPAHSDKYIINESLFDWSRVAGKWTPGADIFEFLERDHALWQQSGICPDPRAYEVESSSWLDEVGATQDGDRRWRHYLILGHDGYVEVIAEGCEILEGQVLAGW